VRITAKITHKNPVHTRLSVWVNGGLITNPGGICLRNDEVFEFLKQLGVPMVDALSLTTKKMHGFWEVTDVKG